MTREQIQLAAPPFGSQSFAGAALASPKNIVSLPLDLISVSAAGPQPDSLEAWADFIRTAYGAKKANTRDEILQLGRSVNRAKSTLIYGKWNKLWNLPRESRPSGTKRTSDTYALIGEVFGELDGKWTSHLPGSVAILYVLAQLGQKVFLELIVAGRIHERLSKAEAEALKRQFQPRVTSLARRFHLNRALASLGKLMDAIELAATEDERDAFFKEFGKRKSGMAAKSFALKPTG